MTLSSKIHIPSLCATLMLLALPGLSTAQDGTWITNATGGWSDTNNWNAFTIADGTSSTADFSMLDIDADRTIHLDATRVIGGMVFGDTDTNSPANWIVDNNGNNANIFDFGGGQRILSVSVTSGVTATFSARIGDIFGGYANGDKLRKFGAGTLILTVDNWLNKNTDEGNGSVEVMGGGELRISDGLTVAANVANPGRTGSKRSYIGQNRDGGSSPSNTLSITDSGQLVVVNFSIGNGPAGNGHNRLIVSRPGTSFNESLYRAGVTESDLPDFGPTILGGSTTYNSWIVTNGAYVAWDTGKSFYLGYGAGGDHNFLHITGADSTLAHRSDLHVGAAGSDNRVVVDNGAQLLTGRLQIGNNGGSNNVVLVTGAGSRLTQNRNQPSLGIGNHSLNGSATPGKNNSLLIEDGGNVDMGNLSQNRGYHVGGVTGADDNFICVDGIGSSFTCQNDQPLSVGGRTGQNNNEHYIRDSDARGNFIEVINGASALFKSVYVMGNTNGLGLGSKFIIGNGTNVSAQSTAMVGFSSGNAMYDPGIVLYNPSAQLIFDNGRLIANAADELVSGFGIVSNAGPAFISTVFISKMETRIVGPGDLIKEGVGTLVISATNSYAGTTFVSNGVLRLTHPEALPASASVSLSTGTKVDLDFIGVNTIRALTIEGAQQFPGFYGQSRAPIYFSGTGLLFVEGTVPPGLMLIVR
jgi:autotransporter-associated beta strand protein